MPNLLANSVEGFYEMETTAAVKERPILFSGPMVRAILDGRKTQTRRIVSKSNSICSMDWLRLEFDESLVPEVAMKTFADDGYLHVATRPHPLDPQTLQGPDCWSRNRVYPRWTPGDRLWVKETWAYFGGDEYLYTHSQGSVQYRADNPLADPWGIRWRPSIHMPRWASRITLTVTDVRVERLQDISEADAIAEGVETVDVRAEAKFSIPGPAYRYQHLWNSINGEGSWEANPWCWVIEFTRTI